jgi:hypothetical protein
MDQPTELLVFPQEKPDGVIAEPGRDMEDSG